MSKTFPETGRPRGGRSGGVVALDGVDLDVARASFTAILGPSGCGKTTLLRSIAGFETPDSGCIEIDGQVVLAPGARPLPAHARGVGVVPQDGALFPHLTVAQNVGFGLRGLARGDRRRRVAEVLDLVGLGDLGRRRPHELSGGQQQRVALARALAPRPRLILLDEPFSALDAHLRQSLRAEVRQLLLDVGTTAVLVTHDRSEAFTMADHLVVMRQGRVVSDGNPRDAYFRPSSIALGQFLGEAVVLPGRVEPGRQEGAKPVVSCALGRLPVRTWHGRTGPCRVLIRPESIGVAPAPARDGGTATGTVVAQSFFGHDELLEVAVPGLAEHVAVRITGEHAHRRGEAVALQVHEAVCTFSDLGEPNLT
ncbi:MAG: ABC transporter ATP-binding protein [Actinomycetes bacterium]